MKDYSDTVVVLPCFNEAIAIRKVIRDFREHLPGAAIHVFDNNSSDSTALIARQSGATVHNVIQKGKGNVVSRMFADIVAPVVLMADGDGTYPAASAPDLIEAVRRGADMAVGIRKETAEACYRRGHRIGNKLLTGIVNVAFNLPINDMLSGYRAFSNRFVKAFPARSQGFEIETELTVFALEHRLLVGEIPISYLAREGGSASKLRTYKDGFRILLTIAYLIKEVRPLLFFSCVAVMLALIAGSLGASVLSEFISTGLVPRFPTAILASALVVVSCIMFCIGIILDAVSALRRQSARQSLLQVPIIPPKANESIFSAVND